jgi:hypothetical protein
MKFLNVQRCRLSISTQQCRFCLVVLRCEPNSASVLNLFFTNEILFATITCPLHDPFYSRVYGSASPGELERNGGDVRWATPGGRPLHPAKT